MFRTRSQLPPGSSAARPIIVNDYALDTESFSEHDLLYRGHLAAGHETVWVNINLRETPRLPVASTNYLFAQKPPENSTKRSPPRLSDWNADADSTDEVFNLDDLEEFQSTDLDNLLSLRNTPKRSFSEASFWSEPPPTKRRKLDVASLRDTIPQPHMFPSAASKKKPSIAAYSRTKPIPIPPHTLPLPDPLPYTRRSWVIPVRGHLPWQHATSAVVLLDPTALPVPPDPSTLNNNEIAWTTASLRALWSFLRLLRDKGAGGPLGLSFHVSPYVSPSNTSNSSQPSYPEMGAQPIQPMYTQDTGAATSIVSSTRFPANPLTFMDHIKVYHDAAHSMQIRNLLDAWPFEAGGAKIRVIKTSRLVLIDERSKGIVVL